MSPVSSILSPRSSRSNSSSSLLLLNEKSDLPAPATLRQPRLRMRALLGNYLYRRVALWLVLVCLLCSTLLLKTEVRSKTAKAVGLDAYLVGQTDETAQPPPLENPPISLEVQEVDVPEAPVVDEEPEEPAPQVAERLPAPQELFVEDEKPIEANEPLQPIQSPVQSETPGESPTPTEDEIHAAASEAKARADELRREIRERQKALQAQRQKHLEEKLMEEAEEKAAAENSQPVVGVPQWMVFKHLNGYFNGLKSLVSKEKHEPEWPNPTYTGPNTAVSLSHDTVPTAKPYRPYPAYKSSAYLAKHPHVEECFLDEDRTPVPDIYAYEGIPQSFPDPAFGDYNVLGIRDDVCFDRFGKYGPYGLGYKVHEGGTGEGMDTDQESAEAVWAKTGKIDYSRVDWGNAQQRCVSRNKHRFINNNDEAYATPADEKGIQKLQRQAVIVRTYVGFRWTQHVIMNFRAMISELNLKTGGEFTVHFLLHVKDLTAAIWADQSVVQRILDDNVPAEFHSICTLWSEDQMRLYYPGDFGRAFQNPSRQDIHGVYRSAHLPMQVFAIHHPEYAHIWNWELDLRYTGSFYEFLDRTAAWARRQSRQLLWERSAKYYIPSYHGSWENFMDIVGNETESSGHAPILGPVRFPGRLSLHSEGTLGSESVMPPSCDNDQPPEQCGVGEEADIITFNPLFDTEDSGWVFSRDVTGYNTHLKIPPRRCAIITVSRLSRRLLLAMHEETWRHHHSMFSEMFPPTVALHHGFKAAFAPHPVFLDRGWAPEAIDSAFNGGRDGSSGGHGSPFDLKNEHNHRGTSFYYNAEFSGLMWRRWLGYPQIDRRGDISGRAGVGLLRGGRPEEESALSSGRMCLRSMLLHPIKFDNPAEKL